IISARIKKLSRISSISLSESFGSFNNSFTRSTLNIKNRLCFKPTFMSAIQFGLTRLTLFGKNFFYPNMIIAPVKNFYTQRFLCPLINSAHRIVNATPRIFIPIYKIEYFDFFYSRPERNAEHLFAEKILICLEG